MKESDRLPIFRSPEQIRLLGELFLFSAAPLSVSELARRAKTSVAGAHKEVERLEAAGLVTSTQAGRSRLVEVNRGSPLYSDLHGLLAKTVGPEPSLRSALSRIDGIREAYIYGSWADPAATSPGDIDLLIVGEPNVSEVYDAVSIVEADVERPVNVTIRSSDEWDSADGAFERSIRSGPRIELI